MCTVQGTVHWVHAWVRYIGYMGTVHWVHGYGTGTVRVGYGYGAGTVGVRYVGMVCGYGTWVRYMCHLRGCGARVHTCDKVGSSQLLFHRYCMGRVGMGWEGQRPLSWVLIK